MSEAYGPELAYLDHQLAASEGQSFFERLHRLVACALDLGDPKHESIYRWKGEQHGKSELVESLLASNFGGTALHLSDQIHALTRLRVFWRVEDRKGDEPVRLLVVPSWTRKWHEDRLSADDVQEHDFAFGRSLLLAMWWFGDEWPLLYTLRDILSVVPVDRTAASTKAVWTALLEKRNYVTNERYSTRRTGLNLQILERAGLVVRGDVGWQRTSKDPPDVLANRLCPLAQLEAAWQGDRFDLSIDKARSREKKRIQRLRKDLYGRWSIASAMVETGRKEHLRGRKGWLKDALRRIQAGIWGGADSRFPVYGKKTLRDLRQTPWLLMRAEQVGGEDRPSISLEQVRSAPLLKSPMLSDWATVDYKDELAEILGIERDSDVIKTVRWGREGRRFLAFTKLKDHEERIALCQLSAPEIRAQLVDGDLDTSRDSWELPEGFKPYEWQEQATRRWWKGAGELGDTGPLAGMVKVVTGAGKTVFALGVVREYLAQYPDAGVLVVVPTRVLLHQWQGEFAKYLNVGSDTVTLAGDGHDGHWEDTPQTRVVIGVVNSLALTHVQKRLSKGRPRRVLVVADECHRYRGTQFRTALDFIASGPDVARLGLSATPLGAREDVDVDWDEATAEEQTGIVEGRLGREFFAFGYEQARAQGIIPPFEVHLVAVPLLPKERAAYDHLSKKIRRSRQKVEDAVGHRLSGMSGPFEARVSLLLGRGVDVPGATEYFNAIRERKRLLSYRLELRDQCAVAILDKTIQEDKMAKALVFQQEIEQIRDFQFTDKAASAHGYFQRETKTGSVHSRRPPTRNEMTLDLLRGGYLNCILCARQLDEGVDVPAVDVGVVRIPPRSLRTTIQRLGRILRRKKGKKLSRFYVLYAEGTIETRLFHSEGFRELIDPSVLKYSRWNPEGQKLDDLPTPEEVWSQARRHEVNWESIELGAMVKARVVGGQFSVSADWRPFTRVEDSREARRYIQNRDYVAVAEFMRSIGQTGAVYYNSDGYCVTYQRGRGGTYVGHIYPQEPLELQLTAKGSAASSQRAAPVKDGSKLSLILGMLNPEGEES